MKKARLTTVQGQCQSLEEAQQFVVEEAEIIMRSQRLYGVESNSSVSLWLRLKVTNLRIWRCEYPERAEITFK